MLKKTIVTSLLTLILTPIFAQNTQTSTDNVQVTRQGFGDHRGLSLNVGFVNPKAQTDGSAYYFDTWDTKAIIYTKNEGVVHVEKVNINLYDNTLEAIYDENQVFTFTSDNLVKVIIEDKVFRVFDMEDTSKIYELVHSKGLPIYKDWTVSYTEASVNPMHIRKNNKYLKKEHYYLYENKSLNKLKLSKKAFSKRFQSENISDKDIVDYIKKNKLSLSEEQDLLKMMTFLTR